MKALFTALFLSFLFIVSVTVHDVDGEREESIDKYALVEFTPKIGTILITDLSPEEWPDDLHLVASLPSAEALTLITDEPYGEMLITTAKKKPLKVSEEEIYISYSNTAGFRFFI